MLHFYVDYDYYSHIFSMYTINQSVLLFLFLLFLVLRLLYTMEMYKIINN